MESVTPLLLSLVALVCALSSCSYVSRDINKAKLYAQGATQATLKVRVTMFNVKRIDRKGGMQTTWHDAGYDAAWVPAGAGVGQGKLEETCVWDPAQVEVWDDATNTYKSYPQSHVP